MLTFNLSLSRSKRFIQEYKLDPVTRKMGSIVDCNGKNACGDPNFTAAVCTRKSSCGTYRVDCCLKSQLISTLLFLHVRVLEVT